MRLGRGWSQAKSLCLLAGVLSCGPPHGQPQALATPPAATARSPAETSRLVGRWMRTDGDYRITIDEVGEDGRVVARYSNPRPIDVSRAAWKRERGKLRLAIAIKNRNRPGGDYELTYEPTSDVIYGTYHDLGRNQDFDVTLYRQVSRTDMEGAP